MKTPMQILLSELNQFPEGREALKKTRWEELLEKEKQMIVDALNDYIKDLNQAFKGNKFMPSMKPKEWFEQYFNENFKQ